MLTAHGATHGILRATTLFRATTASIAMVAGLTAATAQAQVAPPTNLASVCSGVSLPRSVVTDIMRPVIGGVVTPVENTVNSVLGLPLIGTLLPLVPDLSIDATGLLNTAASGQDIRLQTVATDGTLIGPGTPCNAQADSLTLTNPAGLSIGGNRITGLGAAGNEAFASSIDAIAFGDLARTDAAAAIAIGPNATVGAGGAGSVALGSGASATSANSVALGAGSIASRGVAEVSVGAPGAERIISNVAGGTAPTDAVNFGQLATVSAGVTALADRAVQYDDTTRTRITLGGGAGGTVIGNMAPGTLSAASTEGVNGAQLFATNQLVAGNTTAIVDLNTRVDANTTDITNLTTQVGANTTNIANLDTRIDGNTTAITNITTRIDGTDASIVNLNTSIANTNTAVTNLTTQVGNGAIGPVQYSNASTPETPNGGVRTNSVALVGANAGPVGLHNVAGGRIAAGSTDAINGGQVFALAGASVNAVTYDTDASGARTNTITLAGGTATAPVRIANVAAGAVAVGSSDAVNGGQLAATNAAVTTAQGTANTAITNAAAAQGTANTALALGRNSVQYDSVGGGVTLNPTGGAVALRNVAAGTSGLDAVNLNQLRALDFDLRNDMTGLRTEAQRGTAVALAANGMRFDDRAGRTSLGGAVSYFRGETGVALGLGHTSRNQRLRYNAAVSFSPNGGKNVGAVAGATFSFGDD